jgi:hypothetical protein
MSKIEARSQTETTREIPWSPGPAARDPRCWPQRILALSITFATVALAIVLGQAMWDAYMAGAVDA